GGAGFARQEREGANAARAAHAGGGHGVGRGTWLLRRACRGRRLGLEPPGRDVRHRVDRSVRSAGRLRAGDPARGVGRVASADALDAGGHDRNAALREGLVACDLVANGGGQGRIVGRERGADGGADPGGAVDASRQHEVRAGADRDGQGGSPRPLRCTLVAMSAAHALRACAGAGALGTLCGCAGALYYRSMPEPTADIERHGHALTEHLPGADLSVSPQNMVARAFWFVLPIPVSGTNPRYHRLPIWIEVTPRDGLV